MRRVDGARYVVFRDPRHHTGGIHLVMKRIGMVVGDRIHSWTGSGPRFHTAGIPLERAVVLRDATPREVAVGVSIHD